jgi:thioredoxin reductase (NADPH)
MEFNLTPQAQASPSVGPQFEKVLILGAGPAGLAAALYAARAELAPLVLTGLSIGGQAATTHLIENYPGFPTGIGGAELGEQFRLQAERFGARFDFDSAVRVDLSSRPFGVFTYDREFRAETLILAMGASPNHLNIPGEKELTGRGVSYCGTCDGWFFKGKRVAVVGGGDSALEEAIFLTRYAESVTIIHRRDTLRGGAILQNRARENPKISFIWDTLVTAAEGTGALSNLKLHNVKTGSESDFATDGLFIFIGNTPNTDIFRDQLALDDKGYVVTNAHMETGCPGVFAAGEVTDSVFRQVVTSAGMGAAAAIQAIRFLEEHER